MRSRTTLMSFTVLAILAGLTNSARAAFNFQLSYDEFGNANMNGDTLNPGVVTFDPISGTSTLAYVNQLNGNPGDILIIEPGGATISDLIRFEGPLMYFYSDVSTSDPSDSLADVGIPFPQANQIINEVGAEGSNSATWTPGPTDIGGNPNLLITYNFVSDGVLPEPGSLLLAGLGASLLVVRNRRRSATT